MPLQRKPKAACWRGFLSLRSLEAHNFHDLDLHTGHPLGLRVIGQVDPRALQASVTLPTAIFERDVISLQHDRIEHPAISFALHMADDSRHVELIEPLMLL